MTQPSLLCELQSLGSLIEVVRRDLAALRPREISEAHVPDANDELDAVVLATETATETIFEAVEAIEAMAGEMDDEKAQPIVDEVTKIYEACSFQDITGQRIRKVVKALEEIDGRVTGMLATVGGIVGEVEHHAAAASDSAAGEEALMNGPQLPGGGIDQSEVDALLQAGAAKS